MELIIIIIIVTLLALKLLFTHYKPRVKGRIGESLVALSLSKLNKNDYFLFNDLYLSHNGYTTQIDHLIVSIHGIFVIETKNYKGWIFGNEKSTYWTQTIYGNRNKFYNPILQNWKHINFLKQLSPELKCVKYFPIIVFTGSGELKNIESEVPVIYLSNLKKLINNQTNIVLTHNELKQIIGFINQYSTKKKENKKKHKESFKTLKSTENRTCPKCGSYLIIKKGKYSNFLGCSAFPNCRYTKRIQ